MTTVVNAYVKPSCRTYLGRLADLAPDVLVMTSAGGLVPLARGDRAPCVVVAVRTGGGRASRGRGRARRTAGPTQ